ncbi:MAG: transcriptional regulator [Oscillatoriaceae cyanobacterium Prado104]|nr:transcriptional regulator [Oscillatoriaceae cyanobacterium Prado104]
MLTNKMLGEKFDKSAAGYTTIELLIIVVVLGIVSAIAAPAWLMFINNQRLKVSLDRAYSAMVTARSNAKRDKIAWQATFKQVGKTVQVAVHKADISPGQVPASQWKNLESQIQIYADRNSKGEFETTLLIVDETNQERKKGTIWRAMFNYQGCPVSRSNHECGLTSINAKGTLTLIHPDLRNSERCIIISTILGHKRISQRQKKPYKGRFCY